MKEKIKNRILTVVFIIISIIWIAPIVIVLFNAFKDGNSIALAPFRLPGSETFVGIKNFFGGISHGNYPF